LSKLHHLYDTEYRNKNFWEQTLKGIVKYGVTNDPKELQERQVFFELLGKVGFDHFDAIFKRVNHFTWVAHLQEKGYRSENYFRFDYAELKRFNLSIWEELFRISEERSWFGLHGKGIVEDVLSVVELERILGNLPEDFDVALRPAIERLERFVSLVDRYERARGRTYEWKYRTTASVAERICRNVA
jgi:hypothetical protein